MIPVEDRPRLGAANMAADAALLDAAAAGTPGGRWYRWNKPTVSLGHFQKPGELAGTPLAGLPVVQRLSGGGAIVHHHEWTYALAVPRTHRLARRPEDFYEAVHGVLTEELATHGVAARLRGTGGSSKEDPTLCFLRQDPRDVVVTDAGGRAVKVIGSAQRRRKGAVLQHGSMLVAASPHASAAVGLAGACGLSDGAATRVAAAVVRAAAGRFAELLAGEAAEAAGR